MGKPIGYDQIAPGRDIPKATNPLQAAVQGSAPAGAPMPSAPPQYPSDPSMTAWRQRQPGGQPKIQPQVQPQQMAAPSLQFNPSDPNNVDYMKQQINKGYQEAYGRPADQDNIDYYTRTALSKGEGWNPYWDDRVHGKGASGKDAALFGQWAGGDKSVQQQHQGMSPLLSAVMNSSTGEVPYYKQLLSQLGLQM